MESNMYQPNFGIVLVTNTLEFLDKYGVWNGSTKLVCSG
jgi:hypothetical protein